MVVALPPPLNNESYILEHKGSRNPYKILSFKELIKQESPTVVFLYETKLEEVGTLKAT